MSEQTTQPVTEQNSELNNMFTCYDDILDKLQQFEAFSASQIICNVINEHIKRLTATIKHHNQIAEEAEKSMEALADGLRRLRVQAQQVVDDTHNNVIRMSAEDRDPEYSEPEKKLEAS